MRDQVIQQLQTLDRLIDENIRDQQDGELRGLLAEQQVLLEKLISLATDGSQDDQELVEYLTKTLEENKNRLTIYHQRRQQLSTLINNYQSLQRYLDDATS